ncbi:MAG TPA: 3-keto-5-aminohexanoate cleavage protein [Parvularculaceae bacterium]|nr:3-keto-5-aminohexanoate cleavage protein [Amphiplicatus sp.]HPE31689.1 3-keto-5-aminohexanoate cleavage protein [Parvularculaceae bacterium]
MTDKVVITAGLTGALTRKQHNPAVPYRPEEWAAEVRRCEEAGAAIIAVHFREFETGEPTVDSVVMKETMQAITENCGCIINLSTGVGLGATLEERKQPILQYRPEMASLNPGSTNFCLVNWRSGEIVGDFTYENPFHATVEFGRIMREKKIKPEMECFAPSHIETVKFLHQHYDLSPEPLHFGLVFGVAGAMQFSHTMLSACLNLLPQNATWVGIGIGPVCYKIMFAAAAFGGHIRVGLEDNVRIDETSKQLSKGSWDQVEQAVAISRIVGREAASPDEARVIFGLRAKGA